MTLFHLLAVAISSSMGVSVRRMVLKVVRSFREKLDDKLYCVRKMVLSNEMD